MLHRLRFASNTKSFNKPLKNIVEVDETYIGGRERNKHISKRIKGTQGRNTFTKTPVLGMIERKGNIKAMKIVNIKTNTIMDKVTTNVVIGTKFITDDFKTYRRLSFLFKHEFVKHSEGE